jgi:vancomycin aglycone glucosyltransferase
MGDRRRVLLTSIGSRGDVQPLAALGLALQEQGALARVCAAPNFQTWIETLGLEFIPMGPDLRAFSAGSAGTARQRPTRRQAREMIQKSTADSFAVLGRAAEDCAALVVGGALQTAGRSIAEVRCIPYRYAAYCPVVLPSPDHPPPRFRRQALPSTVNRLLWMSYGMTWNALFREPVNQQRKALGLPPIKDLQNHVATSTPWLAADPQLAPAGRNRSLDVHQPGAWLLPPGAPLPGVLEDFLSNGAPPVYVGFGSMVRSSLSAGELLAAVRAAGHRMLLSRGWANLALDAVPEDCLIIDEVDHGRLLPRVAAVVHHGGAGTTTAAARAGRPQVIVPQIYDQFYWGHRVQQLGVGVVCSGELTHNGLRIALQHCCSAPVMDSAAALATRMTDTGAEHTARLLLQDIC